MRIETVVGAAAEQVFDDDVPAIVRTARNIVDVIHFACGNRVNDIQRFAARVALQRANVDPFMKSGLQNGDTESARIADESVLPAFPGSADYTLEIPFDVLIKP